MPTFAFGNNCRLGRCGFSCRVNGRKYVRLAGHGPVSSDYEQNTLFTSAFLVLDGRKVFPSRKYYEGLSSGRLFGTRWLRGSRAPLGLRRFRFQAVRGRQNGFVLAPNRACRRSNRRFWHRRGHTGGKAILTPCHRFCPTTSLVVGGRVKEGRATYAGRRGL